MSLGSGPMSPKRWRPLEQVGWGVGIVAGGIVLMCLGVCDRPAPRRHDGVRAPEELTARNGP